MELRIQEVHYYNDLVNKGFAEKISCPMDETDIVISKLDEKNEVFFYCISCKTSFYPGINLIEKIKAYIQASFIKKNF